MQHDGGRHSLVVVVDNGKEDGSCLEAADFGHLGNMFVFERQAVDAGRVQGLRLVGGLVVGDHFLAAAGVAGQGEAGERVGSRDDAHPDERGSAGDETGRVAAGVGDPVAGRDGGALVGGELREAVSPAVGSAVGGGSVDDADAGVIDQRDGLDGACVGQAQEDDVRPVEEFAALFVVVALVFVDAHQFQVVPGADPVKNLQAGGAALSVYVYFCFAHAESLDFFEY